MFKGDPPGRERENSRTEVAIACVRAEDRRDAVALCVHEKYQTVLGPDRVPRTGAVLVQQLQRSTGEDENRRHPGVANRVRAAPRCSTGDANKSIHQKG